MNELSSILKKFLPTAKLLSSNMLSGGLIHQTYKIHTQKDGDYVLQCLNTAVFANPEAVMNNTLLIQQYLIDKHYPLQLSTPLLTVGRQSLYWNSSNECWRCCKFITSSECYETPVYPKHIYQTGEAFGIFISYLKDFDSTQLATTIPDFHNIHHHYNQLVKNLQYSRIDRKMKAVLVTEQIIQFYQQFSSIDFTQLPTRVTHNDCKLSNLLFNKKTQNCIAVIDLDTVMAGYIPTDFGDMVRTLCNSATEDEQDLNLVHFNIEAYQLLHDGFIHATSHWITDKERESLFSGAIYIILEQAIRFLSDYLNNDKYYTVLYEKHNLIRAQNQLQLLKSLLENQKFKLLI